MKRILTNFPLHIALISAQVYLFALSNIKMTNLINLNNFLLLNLFPFLIKLFKQFLCLIGHSHSPYMLWLSFSLTDY